MNVMVNSYCNAKCPYCFADEAMFSCETNNMSSSDFEKVIDYHKRNNIRVMRLIGGEPSLHPYFTYFLHRICSDNFFEGVHFFSNMTFGQEVLESIILLSDVKRVTILPNFNSKNILGDMYENVVNNIKILAEKKVVENIGINIYHENFDYKYAIDLAKECGIKNIRWSITTPNFEVDKDFDVKGYFSKYYNVLYSFLKDVHNYGMVSNMDCNNIPMCVFTDEQIVSLIKYKPDLFSTKNCSVVVDISPKLNVFRCFGLSDKYETKLDVEQPIYELENKLFDETKNYYDNLLFDDCKKCPTYERNGHSCSCILYRIKR